MRDTPIKEAGPLFLPSFRFYQSSLTNTHRVGSTSHIVIFQPFFLFFYIFSVLSVRQFFIVNAVVMLHKKWDKVSSTRWPATLWPIGTCASNITRSKHKGTTLNTADVTHTVTRKSFAADIITITTSSSCYISIRHFWPPSYVSFPPQKIERCFI